MDELGRFLLISTSALSCLAIAYFSVKLLSIATSQSVTRIDSDIFPQLELPSSVAERYELLKNDPSGDILEKVKYAARMKIAKPQEFFATIWLRRAGVNDQQTLQEWRARLLRYIAVALITSIVLGLTANTFVALLLAPLAFVTADVFILFEIRRAGDKRERVVNEALRAICAQLRTLMSDANDVVTCLGAITRTASHLLNPDPVRAALSQAVEQMRAGTSVEQALRGAARTIETRHFNALCGYLIMVHSGSREWRRQLDELVASLDDQDKLNEQLKQHEKSKRMKRF